MRILTVSHFYQAHGGGIERVAGQLCRQFSALGHEAVWAASDQDAAPDDATQAVPLACINPTEALTGLPMPILGVRGVAALWREIGQAEAVVVHDALYVTSILALAMARARGKRIVLIQHIASIPFASPVMRKVMALANLAVTQPMLAMADEVVFISDTARADLLGTPARRSYRLVFNGVDGAIFHPGAARGGGTQRILFVGRYVVKKGLAVIRALATARPELRIDMAGSGPIRPDEWGLANVTDLGVQTPQALAELYRNADLLLLPSVGEGYPLVIQEAMACGLPVVCGTPADRADPAASAWLRGVPIDLGDAAGSARACGEAIDALALSSVQREEMAAYAAHNYSWRAMAEAVVAAASA